ncbi:maleylacetoacetate isomerase maia [Aspergillus campestris IBT 28561]|uniref:Maleylacetoacetate isomerase maia n=1 Tax=Aspergillus campestris (strain IBT 28561) TaxID=1392248 RepID=A0A2I1D010_ASPC2|nr:maleylacetoacetate isomerase maia [Aspergillus campestris IBT 28561]PKY03217.1 maleylacetoacetate isomerase maia [Aspergillus campestris IBT 28561]
MTDSTPKITLYTYFRSSCSARLRIALNLKNIPYTPIPINLLKGEQRTATNTTLNPSATVPTLIAEYPTPAKTVTITQSLPALEYLEEITPSTTPSLLPPASSPELRAVARTLANIIACDVQPVTNLRILKRVEAYGVDRTAWAKELTEDGLRAYEAVAASVAGEFSVGDSITIADVCLLPAVWNAQRVGVDLEPFPVIRRVVERLEEVDAVKRGHWRAQADTPEEFRV